MNQAAKNTARNVTATPMMSRTTSEPLREQQGDEEVDGDQQRDHGGRDVRRHQGSLLSPATYRKLPAARTRSSPSIQISSGMRRRLGTNPSMEAQRIQEGWGPPSR